jgi:MerR family transcriptional regulator, heat shock protein HspR
VIAWKGVRGIVNNGEKRVRRQWRRTRFAWGEGVTAEETGVERLDDQDFPAVTMGHAAELLGVRPAFLRSLDAAGVLAPQRSEGGHRRYSRRQLALASRLRELFDEGMTLEAATRIVGLQDELALAREQLSAARDRLGEFQARELDAARDQLAVARARVADLEARDEPRRTPAPGDGPT